MKFMNKIGLALAVLLPVTALAQSGTLWPRHKSQSFLTVQSITSSNAVGITNLVMPGVSVTGTNWLNTYWTNNAGTLVRSTASTYTNVNLLGSVELWSRGDGAPGINQTNGILGWINSIGDANISYRLKAGAAANTANIFIFKPSWDGTNVDSSGAADFTFAVTPTADGVLVGSTNVPMWKWVGAKRLYCAVWTNPDADATGLVTLQSLRLNGFAPP